MAKAAKKARGKFVDEKYLGPEPDLSGHIPSMVEMAKAYNWYNYFYNNDDAKGFVLDYLKKHHKNEKDLIRGISSNVPADRLRTLGWSARILSMGGNLQSGYDFITHAKKTLDANRESESFRGLVSSTAESGSISEDDGMGETTAGVESNGESTPSETTEKVSIQDRIKNKASELIGEIEDEIDTFICEGANNFDVKAWLRNRNVKPQISIRIADFYRPLYSELFDALNGKDDELKKAYSHLTKPVLRAYVDFVRGIVSACETQVEIAKAVRKPRKKKDKPASQVVSKIKYKLKDDTYDVQSVNPTELVKSNQLWVFNCKTRTLSVYNAMGPAGLSLKGTTLTGYDEKTSISKTLRKPKEQLAELKTAGKITLRKFMDNINCKAKNANGRINTETVLVKVIK